MDVATVAKKAFYDRYNALTFTPRPTMWPDKAPIKDSTGTVVTIPYVILRVYPLGVMDWMNALDRIELVRVSLEVYGTTALLVTGYVAGIEYDGSAPGARAGLDDAATLTLPTGYYLNKCERQTPGTVMEEEPRGSNAGPVYRADLVYDVELFRDGDLGA